MKKILLLLLATIFAVTLAACGDDPKDDNSKDNDGESQDVVNKKTEEDTGEEVEDVEDESNDNSEGETTESELGSFTMVNQKMDLEETHESGPMKLTINSIQSGDLIVSDDYKDFLDGKDEVTMISVDMKAENTSEDNVSWYPDQAVMTTNAGDQVDADILLSDSVGGDFFGPTNKEGSVLFIFDTSAEEIDTIKLIIDGPHDEGFETIGEKLEVELSF